jgi:uncharacterized membrane protein
MIHIYIGLFAIMGGMFTIVSSVLSIERGDIGRGLFSLLLAFINFMLLGVQVQSFLEGV